MVSATQQTRRRRHNRDQKLGQKRKRKLAKGDTPSFSLDPQPANAGAESKSGS